MTYLQEEDVLSWVASLPDDKQMLRQTSREWSVEQWKELAIIPTLSDALYQLLAQQRKRPIDIRLAANPGLPAALQHRLFNQHSDSLAKFLAGNPGLIPDLLQQFVTHQNVNVRHTVCHNPALPPHWLMSLVLSDPSQDMRFIAKSRLHDLTPPDWERAFLQHPDLDLAMLIESSPQSRSFGDWLQDNGLVSQYQLALAAQLHRQITSTLTELPSHVLHPPSRALRM